MSGSQQTAGAVRFGVFEVDREAGEIRKNGLKVHLQEQPFRALAVLLERPGKVVSREELRERLWPSDTFVDFDRSLNTAINKIREALGDSAENPRFLETLPRRGYRFLASVEQAGHTVGTQPPVPGAPAVPEAGHSGAHRLGEDPNETGPHQPATLVVRAQQQTSQVRRQSRLTWALSTVAVLAVAAALAVSFVYFRAAPSELPLRRFAYTPSAAMLARRYYRWSPNLAISPDVKHIAFTTGAPYDINGQLWVQDLDQPQPRLVVDGGGAVSPFWSPDSNHIGFTTVGTSAGEVKRVPVQGGPSSRVCASPGTFWGGTWSSDGEVIVFSASNEADAVTVAGGGGVDLYEVPASGGTPKPVLLPERSEEPAGRRENRPYWPHFLPREAGSRVLVYANARSAAEHTLMVHDLTTGRREELGPGAFPVYALSGHLVFQSKLNNCDLLAAPFSLKSLQFTGERFPIRENACYPSVARDGTLVYLESSAPGIMKQMVWRDRRGAKLGTIGEPQLNLGMPELSPDGRRVLVQSNETGSYDIWVHDVARGVKQRLTFDPAIDGRPVWLPNGQRFSFSSARRGEGGADIYAQPADGTSEAQLLVASLTGKWAYDWSVDETYMIFDQLGQKMDLHYLKRKGDGSGYDSIPFIVSPFDTHSPKLSPNARYLAYESNESGRYEVYVQPFPEGGVKSLVSAAGGHQPRWRGDGKELFYVEGNALMAVSVTTADGFSVGERQRLFEAAPGALEGRGHRYTVTSDGQKFILVEAVEGYQPTVPTIQVTQNWFAEFKGRPQK